MIRLMWFLLTCQLFYYQVYNAVFGEIPYISIVLLILLSIALFFYFMKSRIVIPKDLAIYAIFIAYSFCAGLLIAVDIGLVVTAIVDIVKYFIISIIIFVLITHTRKGAEKIAHIFVWNETFLALLLPIKGVPWSEDVNRIEFLYRSTNIVSMELFIGLIALGYLFLSCRKGKINFLYILQVIVLVTGILLSGSRKILVGIIVLICLYLLCLFFSNQVNMRKKIKIMLALMMTAPIGFFYLFYFTYIGQRFFVQNNGDLYREALFKFGIESFLEHPLLGLGFNNFRYYHGGTYSHNVFSELLSCTGVFGLLIYIVFYIIELYLICIMLKKMRTSRENKKPVYFIIAAIIMMFVLGAVQLHFYYFYFYIFIGFVSGILHAEPD